jgi:hypothetical protein
LAAPPSTRDTAVLGFYNDSYWFDQAACASPRAIYWVGEPAATAAARADFFARLGAVIHSKQPQVDAAMAVEKRVATYGLAVDGIATDISFAGNALATVELAGPEGIPRRWLGTGTFPHSRVAALADLARVVQRRDQTVTHFGFTADELMSFAQVLAGRGVDRMVPIGQALSFSAIWDGYDLMREFTRLTVVQPR